MSGRDPLALLGLALAAMLLATFSPALSTSACILAAAIVVLVGVDGVAPRRIALGLLPFAIFAASISWIQIVAPATGSIGDAAAIHAAGLIFVRTLAIGSVSLAFALTSEPSALGRALVHRAGLPRRVVFGVLAAIQMAPGLIEDIRLARLTARAALPADAGRGIPSRLRRFAAGLSPGLLLVLLAASIRRASAAALAMELRGISAGRPATPWRVPRFDAPSRRVLAIGAATLLAIAVATLP